ncbi:MAG: hypothetical protein M3527_09150 [Actinomycetota bacterium]|nr:hypothetical protein [Actinomycetota bacterium]
MVITEPGFFLRSDYFELLAWLRANAPVHPAGEKQWLVSSYELIREISRQPGHFTSRRGALVNDPMRLFEPDDESGSILHLDPPQHAEYRKLLNREFTPRAAGRVEPAIRRTVEAIFSDLPADGEIDFVERLASPSCWGSATPTGPTSGGGRTPPSRSPTSRPTRPASPWPSCSGSSRPTSPGASRRPRTTCCRRWPPGRSAAGPSPRPRW